MALNPLESVAGRQFTLPEWARAAGQPVDLRNSAYWKQQQQGEGSGTMGNGDGSGYYSPLDQFAGNQGFGENMSGAAGPRPGEAMDWLASSGQQLFEANGGNNENARWLQDAQGNITAEPKVERVEDKNFWTGAQLAALVTGANLYGAYGGAAEAAGGGGASGQGGFGAFGNSAPLDAGFSIPSFEAGGAASNGLLSGAAPSGAGAAGPGGFGTFGSSAPLEAGFSIPSFDAAGAGALSQAGSAASTVAGGAGGAGGIGSSVVDAAKTVGGAMDWSDWAKIGATLIGSGIQSNAASNAVDAQAKSTEAAIAEQRRQFDLQRSDSAAYRDAGVNALSQFQAMNSTPTTAADVMQDPGYQFGLDQGQQAIDRKVAAMGGRVSGQAIKAAGRFGTNYASTGYTAADQRRNDRLNRLASLAGIGQSATNASAAAGSAMANNIGGLVTGQGNAAGGGILAQGNIWGNAANQIAALYGRGNQQPGSRVQNPPVNQYGP